MSRLWFGRSRSTNTSTHPPHTWPLQTWTLLPHRRKEFPLKTKNQEWHARCSFLRPARPRLVIIPWSLTDSQTKCRYPCFCAKVWILQTLFGRCVRHTVHRLRARLQGSVPELAGHLQAGCWGQRSTACLCCRELHAPRQDPWARLGVCAWSEGFLDLRHQHAHHHPHPGHFGSAERGEHEWMKTMHDWMEVMQRWIDS